MGYPEGMNEQKVPLGRELPNYDGITIPLVWSALISTTYWILFFPPAANESIRSTLFYFAPIFIPPVFCTAFLFARDQFRPLQRTGVSQLWVTVPCRLVITILLFAVCWLPVAAVVESLDPYNSVHQPGKNDTIVDWGSFALIIFIYLGMFACGGAWFLWSIDLEYEPVRKTYDFVERRNKYD